MAISAVKVAISAVYPFDQHAASFPQVESGTFQAKANVVRPKAFPSIAYTNPHLESAWALGSCVQRDAVDVGPSPLWLGDALAGGIHLHESLADRGAQGIPSTLHLPLAGILGLFTTREGLGN